MLGLMGLPISPALKAPKNTNENLYKLLYITNGRGCWEVENYGESIH
jgi:hypothetical protein